MPNKSSCLKIICLEIKYLFADKVYLSFYFILLYKLSVTTSNTVYECKICILYTWIITHRHAKVRFRKQKNTGTMFFQINKEMLNWWGSDIKYEF